MCDDSFHRAGDAAGAAAALRSERTFMNCVEELTQPDAGDALARDATWLAALPPLKASAAQIAGGNRDRIRARIRAARPGPRMPFGRSRLPRWSIRLQAHRN
jgi:hypothetical protein